MTDFAVKAQNISFHYGENRALDQVSFEVPKGIVFGFLGPNGSGKTTMIRLLLGLLEPKHGKAEVLGFDVHSQADQIRQRAGSLLEHSGLYDKLSAADNLEYYGRIYRLPPEKRERRIKDLLTHFQLWDRRDQPIKQLSRGMKQKVAIARALIHQPSIIFLDEPTAGLDPVAAASLREDIINLVEKEGASVFLNTHNLPEAEKLCAQVGVISAGKLLAAGTLEQLRAREGKSQLKVFGSGFEQPILDQLLATPQVISVEKQNQHIEINLTDPEKGSEIVRLLVEGGVVIEEVQKTKSSLEDLFLGLMEEDAHVH